MTTTVEVYSHLNPLYYNLPLRKSQDEYLSRFGIFKDLNEDILVSMRDRTITEFKTQLDKQYQRIKFQLSPAVMMIDDNNLKEKALEKQASERLCLCKIT